MKLNEEIERINQIMRHSLNEAPSTFATNLGQDLAQGAAQAFRGIDINIFNNIKNYLDDTKININVKKSINSAISDPDTINEAAFKKLIRETLTAINNRETIIASKLKKINELKPGLSKFDNLSNQFDKQVLLNEQKTLLLTKLEIAKSNLPSTPNNISPDTPNINSADEIKASLDETNKNIEKVDSEIEKVLDLGPNEKISDALPETLPPNVKTTNWSAIDVFKWLRTAYAVSKIIKYGALLIGSSVGAVLLYNYLKNKGEQDCYDKWFSYMLKLVEQRKAKGEVKNKKYYISFYSNNNDGKNFINSVYKGNGWVTIELTKGYEKVFVNGVNIGTWELEPTTCNLTLLSKATKQKYTLLDIAENSSNKGASEKEQGNNAEKTNNKLGYNSFKVCNNNYGFGCKSEKIKQLQRCLNVAQDGKWGENTEKAWVAKFPDYPTKTEKSHFQNDKFIDDFCPAVRRPQTAPSPQQTTPQPAPSPQQTTPQGEEPIQTANY